MSEDTESSEKPRIVSSMENSDPSTSEASLPWFADDEILQQSVKATFRFFEAAATSSSAAVVINRDGILGGVDVGDEG